MDLPDSCKYSRRYCGRGKRTTCRIALRVALLRALEDRPSKLYADARCADAGQPGDQDYALGFRATGAITQPMIGWQNRPTYQQAVEVQGHRPRP